MKRKSKYWNRFWSKVKKGPGCWEWQACKTSYGYGQIGIEGIILYAHRVAWEMGHDLPKGMCVCHSCDNPPCVRPSHLFIGTYKDNSQDASKKGRTARGERSSNASLNKTEIKQIRMDNSKVKEIAKKYNICPSTVSKIRLRRRWKHIPEEKT